MSARRILSAAENLFWITFGLAIIVGTGGHALKRKARSFAKAQP